MPFSIIPRRDIAIVAIVLSLVILFNQLSSLNTSIKPPDPKMSITHVVLFQFNSSASPEVINDVWIHSQSLIIWILWSFDGSRSLDVCLHWRTVASIRPLRSRISNLHPVVQITRPKDSRYAQTFSKMVSPVEQLHHVEWYHARICDRIWKRGGQGLLRQWRPHS